MALLHVFQCLPQFDPALLYKSKSIFVEWTYKYFYQDAPAPAKHTRSKYPMTDVAIDEIENRFKAPDLFEDMLEIDTYADDGDWLSFLATLNKDTGWALTFL